MSGYLGRMAGIDVFVHPTFLLVLAFPGVLDGGLNAILFVLSLFGCVLLHEFGHALMARQFGIETQDITLYPIGGVARLRRLPRAPGAELLIALAGPAVNVAIVLALAGLSFLGLSDLGLFPGFIELLMVANLALALFNLIPAFPMDGGRVLRAALSGWFGRARATMIAVGIGRALALVFGVYSLLYDRDLFHVALAAFIYFAAGAELAQVLAEESRRSFGNVEGIWTAPPGFRWVSRGDGVWQLAPIVAPSKDQTSPTWM